MTSSSASIALVVLAFREEYEEAFKLHPELSTVLTDPDCCRKVGQHAAEHAVHRMLWMIALGPSLTTEELTTAWMGDITAVEQRTQTNQLIYVDGDTTRRYPRWQFDDSETGEFRIRPIAEEVISIFRRQLGNHYRPETVLFWAATPQPYLNDEEPRRLMADPGWAEAILVGARRTAGKLAQ
jgi:hypothetical protein